MKRKIILSESDIRNIVKECVLEYYSKTNVDENRTANILTALGLAAGSVAGINKATNMPQQDMNITAPQTMFANNTKQDKDNTVNYVDYMKQHYQNRFTPIQQQDTLQQTPTKKDTVTTQKKEYYPSNELINFIKSYETFHNGWINDGQGNLTTGWGFKMTPELKKRFPKGMYIDKNGNTPEADAYLIEYINNNLDEFKKSTPNIDKLPQEYADALFDVFYNVGGKVYRNSPNLQHALKNVDLLQIANNLKYGKLKGHKKRSADRKNILKGNYKRS